MYQEVQSYCHNNEVQLVAVSKTKPVQAIQSLYDLGQRDFGENRALELAEKYTKLPQDIRWHMIGHLQTNKIKKIISFVHMIHSVDSLHLAEAINKEARKKDRIVPILLQLKIAKEESKYGQTYQDIVDQKEAFLALDNVDIQGLMGMGTFTNDQDILKAEFQNLKQSFDHLKQGVFSELPSFNEISMGMSGDYKLAIDEGSTMVRVGSLIFGARS